MARPKKYEGGYRIYTFSGPPEIRKILDDRQAAGIDAGDSDGICKAIFQMCPEENPLLKREEKLLAELREIEDIKNQAAREKEKAEFAEVERQARQKMQVSIRDEYEACRTQDLELANQCYRAAKEGARKGASKEFVLGKAVKLFRSSEALQVPSARDAEP